MTFELSELRKEDEDENGQYDPEIFRYLQDLMGSSSVDKRVSGSATPSMSLVMNNMWTQEDLMREDDGDGDTDGDVELQLPDNAFRSQKNENTSSDEKSNESNDVLTQMKEGTTLLKYGKYGGGGYRTFQLSKDHKYLIWFSQKKNIENTRIPIEEIVEIKIGKDSDVRNKEEVQETSFTVIYGKDSKQLNVTAKSPKEAYVWAQGLKILSDAAKRGTNISDLKSLEVEPESSSKHDRTKSVVISMGRHARTQSVMNMFQKNNDTGTIETVVKRHAQLKLQLQRCADFVMNKKNYRTIKSKGEFKNVKERLEKIDVRLRNAKAMFENEEKSKDLSECKAELFSIAADLDALKQMLTVLIRQQKEL